MESKDDLTEQMETAYRFLDKSTKFLFIVGDEILKDTKYKKYQGAFELWE